MIRRRGMEGRRQLSRLRIASRRPECLAFFKHHRRPLTVTNTRLVPFHQAIYSRISGIPSAVPSRSVAFRRPRPSRHRQHEGHHLGQDDRRVQHATTHHQSATILIIDSGGVLCVGGPALVWYVTPTEEELFLVCRHQSLFATVLTQPNDPSAIQPGAPKEVARKPQGQARGL